ncbi:hypothetical protein AB0B30_32675 [Streptomyces narbonensis]|uniref:Uncharacterized protein n=1 Tax=Streptomyces narbonensis TaxID=67333 RepID=A0ABV3CIU8_9ACTN
MGIRLIVEVLTSAPEALTHREKLLLVVLAEDANDDTRTTWNSVERPEVLRGAKLSRSQLYAVLKSLMTKGALERATAGQRHSQAKYRIPTFEVQSPGIPDTETPSQCPENSDTDQPQSPGNADTDGLGQCPENADPKASQCQEIRDVSVPESGTPTPLFPSSTTPSASKQESTDLTYGIPAEVRPLMDALSVAQVNVRWPFKGDGWFPVIALIKKCGIPAMADYATRAAARGPIDSARYFIRGWSELPPLPSADAPRPALRAVAGGWQPYTNPTDVSVYENGW